MDKIRFQMTKVATERDAIRQNKMTVQQQARVVRPSEDNYSVDRWPFFSFETKFLDSFHLASPVTNQINIVRYITSELQNCTGVVLLRMNDDLRTFRIYYRGKSPCDSGGESYQTADFECILEILSAKIPIVHTDESSKQLMILCQWKPLLGFIPDLIVGLPITQVENKIIAVVGMAFKNKLPKGFVDRKLPALQENLEALIPYAFVNQATTDNREDVNRINRVIESIDSIERSMGTHTTDIALTNIGQEIANLVNCKELVIFTVDLGDNILRKFHTNFGSRGKSGCPDKKIHTLTEIPLGNTSAAALSWVAYNKKGMRINHAYELQDYGIITKVIHTIGSCNARSMILAPVVDYSGESCLVIEISERERDLHPKDYELALLFCQHTACLLTTTVLLDHREKSNRRKNIINEMLCNISFVKRSNVEQFISHHRKTSSVFRGSFDEFSLCIRLFPENDIAGIALEVFFELDIVKEFKIRRSVLVRFILSVQQGYGSLPYHNWYHAVSVGHYAYLLIKKLKLVENGHLTKLEAFALIVSALTHDIDHRGTNNQFQSYANSDIYKLYDSEDSVMERHHLAIALAVLHREDCNILESFNDTDYKYFVELLTWNIIATDISKHLKNRETLFLEAKSSNKKESKMARLSLFMTAADLCDNCKKWDDNLSTVKGILQEFFTQGDMERQLGFTPIPMMDRHVAYVPMIEYKFVKYIVAPVYRFLSQLFVELTPCIKNILHIEDLWTLATVVFEAHKETMDQLDILELSAMKEEQLLRIKFDEPLDQVKKRKFSFIVPMPPPPPPPAPAASPATTERKSGQVNISLKFQVDEGLEEVDTGEKRKKFKCLRCCCTKNEE